MIDTTGQTTTTKYVIQNNLLTGYPEAPYKIRNNNIGQDLSPLLIEGASQFNSGGTFRSSDIHIQGGTKGVNETYVYIHNPVFTGVISGITTGSTVDLSPYWTSAQTIAQGYITGYTLPFDINDYSLTSHTHMQYLTGFTESDPVWNAEKSSYSLTSHTHSQYLTGDTIWNATSTTVSLINTGVTTTIGRLIIDGDTTTTGRIAVGTTLSGTYKITTDGSINAVGINSTGEVYAANNAAGWDSTGKKQWTDGFFANTLFDWSFGMATDSNKSIGVGRNRFTGGVGRDLTISAGGAIVSSTNLNGGNLLLKSGIATGSGSSSVSIFTTIAGSSGTTDVTPTEKMRIDGNGNVGIGTSTPEYKLDITDSGSYNTYGTQLKNGITIKSYSTDYDTSAWLRLYKSNSDTKGTNVSTPNTMTHGVIEFGTWGGGSYNWISASRIISRQVGTCAGLAYAGSNLEFQTTIASNAYGSISNMILCGSNQRVSISGVLGSHAKTLPTYSLSFLGSADQSIGLERNSTTIGKDLSILAGGAFATGINLNGGNLILKSGIATGSGSSYISFLVPTGTTSGSTDTTPIEVVRISNKGLTLIGEGTVYKDISYTMAIERLGSSTSLDTFIGSFRAYTLDIATNDYIEYATVEVPHEFINGSSKIDNHVHWTTQGTDTSNRYIKWQLDIVVANMTINGTTPAVVGSTGITFGTVYSATGETMIPANTPSLTHFYTELSKPLPGQIALGAQMKLLLKRITASGTAPTGKPFVLQVGQHIEVDSFGSSSEYSK